VPALLRNALDDGVTVIMAHAALPMLPPPLESRRYFEELVLLFRAADAGGWKLYPGRVLAFLPPFVKMAVSTAVARRQERHDRSSMDLGDRLRIGDFNTGPGGAAPGR
jgi:hypothetical protein